MSPQLHMDMVEALDWAEMDDETRVVIITGAGGHFCAGQDLKLYFRETENDPKARVRARRAAHTWRWDRLSNFPKPTIAMVHGYCLITATPFIIPSRATSSAARKRRR
jgi:trans-feruloyl-CoA hydratase/vanillin synthase